MIADMQTTQKKRGTHTGTFDFQLIMNLADKVVSRYTYKKIIPLKEQEDVKQEIIHKYLQKKEGIQSSFQGKAKVSTYITAVLNRMCCEIIRAQKKTWYQVQDMDVFPKELLKSRDLNNDQNYIIKNELDYLDKVLITFHSEKAKLVLFLKIYYQLKIVENDILAYTQNKDKFDHVKLCIDRQSSTQRELFEIMAEIQEFVEGKSVKADAIRMWLVKKIDQIICRMNNTYQRSYYSRESLQLLFEFENIN